MPITLDIYIVPTILSFFGTTGWDFYARMSWTTVGAAPFSRSNAYLGREFGNLLGFTMISSKMERYN